MVGGSVVVVVTVVVDVVVPPEPVPTSTPVPQCHPPAVLHTVTVMLLGVLSVDRVKLTPSVCGSTALPASRLLWTVPTQASQTEDVPPEQCVSQTSP